MKLEPKKISLTDQFIEQTNNIVKVERRKISLDDQFISDACKIDTIQEFSDKMAKDIIRKREIVIKQKIKEIVGIEIDFEEESKRRFKRFCTVIKGNEETIYFNDGSIDGRRIVTFVKKDQPLSAVDFTIGYEETYY